MNSSTAGDSIGADFRPFDCDNHYYECEDAFTRHVPDAMRHRVVQWVEMNVSLIHI